MGADDPEKRAPITNGTKQPVRKRQWQGAAEAHESYTISTAISSAAARSDNVTTSLALNKCFSEVGTEVVTG